ncbi:MAG: hydrogenase maturation nickel metallochaperone HypA [Blastocatellia bacterium]|nr:hydrogenase maturation nickel metallochaperone HypA [Blastocatellia bacterium]MBN8722223.1 hydrogenase maturation nickel metallochaperone HypA [Acidobacteriota bacterium]
MHELSIVLSIIEIAKEEAERQETKQVQAVHLKVGQLSGVVKEALLFSYKLACEGTIFQTSQLLIEELPVIVYCYVCQEKKELISIQDFSCPTCKTPSFEILQGRELEIVALEIQT